MPEVAEKQTGLYYLDPLPKLTNNKEELQAYQYCVIDGNCYATQLEPAVLPDGRAGYLFKDVCVGPVEKVKQKIQDRENGVVTPSPDRRQRHPSGVEEGVQKLKPSNDTPKDIPKAKNGVIFGHPGRPKKSLPEKTIKNSKLSIRVLAEKYGVSKSTIGNIKNGQRVLM